MEHEPLASLRKLLARIPSANFCRNSRFQHPQIVLHHLELVARCSATASGSSGAFV